MQLSMICILLIFGWVPVNAKINVLVLSPNDSKKNLIHDTISMGYQEMLKNRGWVIHQFNLSNVPKTFENFQLVIVEETNQLTIEQWKILEEYRKKGGAILLTSSRSENYSEGQDQQLEKFLNENLIPLQDSFRDEYTIQLKWGSPITLNHPPGYELKLRNVTRPMAITPKNSSNVIGYWRKMTTKLDNNVDSEPKVAMLFQSNKNNHRLIWCGFQLSDWEFQLSNLENYELFDEMFDWLIGKATAGIHPWKNGKEGALAIQCISENYFPNIRSLLPLFRKFRIKPTIFTTPNEASKYQSLTKELRKMNAEFALDGERLRHILHDNSVKQAQVIRVELDKFNRIGIIPKGIVLQEDKISTNTIAAINAEDLEYVSTIQLSDRHYPSFVKDQFNPSFFGGIVVLNKTNLNDFELIVQHHKADAYSNADRLYREFQYIQHLHGFYHFTFSAKSISEWNYDLTLDYFLQKLQKSHNVWLTTFEEVAQWVRQREQLRVTTTSTDSTVFVEVVNLSNETVDGAILVITQPKKVQAEYLDVVYVSKGCTYDATGSNLLIELPELVAKEVFVAKLSERKTGWFKVSLKHLPKIVRWSIILMLIFFLSAAWYLFIGRKRHIHAAAEPEQLENTELFNPIKKRKSKLKNANEKVKEDLVSSQNPPNSKQR